MGTFVMQHNVKNLYDTPDKNRHVNVIFLHATLVLYVCYVNRYTNTFMPQQRTKCASHHNCNKKI